MNWYHEFAVFAILFELISDWWVKTPISTLNSSFHLLTYLSPVLFTLKLVLSGKYRFYKFTFCTIVELVVKAAEFSLSSS
ncbi:MAG TPA: hypothetical protein VGE59_00955 [Patescibacteria group bacterium]